MEIVAAVLRQPGAELCIETLMIESPRADELLVRIKACGVCHTDIACRDAQLPLPLPIVLGHEGAGIVEQVGSAVQDLAVGDHVLLSFGYCGACPYCEAKLTPYCDHWSALNFGGARADGSSGLKDHQGQIFGQFFGQSAFASHVLVRRSNAVKIRRDLPLEVLASLGCSIQTGAGAILNGLKPLASDSIAIIGVGAVGLSAVMAARVLGCERIIALDKNPARLSIAQELGATACIQSMGLEQLPNQIRGATGAPVKFVIDTTGSPDVIAASLQAIQRGGTCIMLGIYMPGTQVPIEARYLVRNGLTLRGMVEGDSNPQTFIPNLVEQYLKGRMPLEKLIKRYSLYDINVALKDAQNGSVCKPVIIP